MPLYDYSCSEGHRFERLIPLARHNEAQMCPCGEAARKMISAPMVISDTIPPTYGADGKLYDSATMLNRSEGKEGKKFEFFNGPADISHSEPEYKPDMKRIRDDVEKAMCRVEAGDIPKPILIDE